MTRLAAKYLDAVDNCVRCPTDRPPVHPDGMGSTTDARSVVLAYRCDLGHCWERSFRRSDLKSGPVKVSAARRRHLATTATATIDCADDCTERTGTGTGRTPAPATGWHPTRRLWLPR
jgi:hypothetical protein